MLNKEKRSNLLLIKIKHNKTSLAFPIVLFIFEDIIDSFYELLSFFRKAIRVSQNKPHPADLLDLLRILLLATRSYGQWELVDIEAKGTKVSIKFF